MFEIAVYLYLYSDSVSLTGKGRLEALVSREVSVRERIALGIHGALARRRNIVEQLHLDQLLDLEYVSGDLGDSRVVDGPESLVQTQTARMLLYHLGQSDEATVKVYLEEL